MEESPRELIADAYRAHADTVFRYCLFRTNSRQDAEDITAEVFVKYLLHRNAVKQDRLLPWLLKVAGNLLVDHHRKTKRLQPFDTETVEAKSHPSYSFEVDEMRAAFGALSLKQQQVVYLKVIEGMSFKEAADCIGKKEVTAKALYYRGIKALRKRSKEEKTDVQPLSLAIENEAGEPNRSR